MPAIYLAHGAWGDAASMRPYVKALQAGKLTASAIGLPRSKAERAVPVFIEKVPAGAIAGGASFRGAVPRLGRVRGRFAPPVPPEFPPHAPRPSQGPPPPLLPQHRGPALLLLGELRLV